MSDEYNLSNIYNKYLGEKCSMDTFRLRVKRWMNRFEALKPATRRTNNGKVLSSRFAEEMKRYEAYEWEKTFKQNFYSRLANWRTKEEAIQIWKRKHKKKELEPILEKKAGIKEKAEEERKKELVYRDELKLLKQSKEKHEDYNWIEVRYSKEEAEAFRKEYKRIIADLEIKLSKDEESEIVETKNKIEQIKSELFLFNVYNKEDER